MMTLASLELSDGGIRLLLFAAVLLPGVWLASQRSTYLVDYFIVLACMNRFVRRVLDWATGAYDDRPLSSLAPLLIGCLFALVVVGRLHTFPPTLRRSAKLLFGAIGYAMVIGVTNGLAAVFELLAYLTPVGMLFYGLAVGARSADVDRWILVTTVSAACVALYGWIQWAFLPPWDVAWIEWSGMWRSMGDPVPFEMSVCSTLESRGPYGWFLGAAAVPALAHPRWRRVGGYPIAIFIAASILPSTVRSSWVLLVVGLFVFHQARGAKSWSKLVAPMVALALVLLVAKSQLPQSERMMSRLESIGNLQDDGSLRGRLNIITHGPGHVLGRPLGYGLGSSGRSGKISGTAVVGDNGYLVLITTFGIPGFIALFMGMRAVIPTVARLAKRGGSLLAAIAVAQLGGGLAALVFDNWLTLPYAGITLALIGGAISAAQPTLSRYAIRVPAPAEMARGIGGCENGLPSR